MPGGRRGARGGVAQDIRRHLASLELLPAGLEVHIIFMTELDGDFSYSIQQTTIVDNHVTVFDDPSAFIETDMDGIISAINALP